MTGKKKSPRLATAAGPIRLHVHEDGFRLSSVTRGIRMRVNQELAVDEALRNNPELSLSLIARRGIDLWFAEQEGRIQVLTPESPKQGGGKAVFRSISSGRASD